ncbi:hypothetical protein ACFGVR_07190 [Mucilaginibacter sp. AW1-3]
MRYDPQYLRLATVIKAEEPFSCRGRLFCGFYIFISIYQDHPPCAVPPVVVVVVVVEVFVNIVVLFVCGGKVSAYISIVQG